MKKKSKGGSRTKISLPPKNVVVIGGGSGTFMVLSALRDYNLNLTAIVSMADDGGSTGALRDQYGVLPPGDVRRALVALSQESKTLRELFNYRFGAGDLEGHSFGNIFLSALEKISGNFASAVKEASRVLNLKGSVLPVTLNNIRLNAKLADGKIIKGETNIDIPLRARAKIEKIWLSPAARINPEAKKAILSADLIVIGPGDLYTSLVPNFLVSGVSRAVKKSRAKKIYVCNLMTKYGETQGFHAEDFVLEIEKYLGRDILDYAIFNSQRPSLQILARYKKEKAEFIEPPNVRHLVSDIAKPRYILADLLDNSSLIRHEPKKKLAKVLISMLN